MAISRLNGRVVAWNPDMENVGVWQGQSFERLFKPPNGVSSLACAEESDSIFIGCENGRAYAYRQGKLQELSYLRRDSPIVCLAAGETGSTLVCAPEVGSPLIADLRKGVVLDVKAKARACCAADLSERFAIALIGCRDGSCVVVRLRQGSQVRVPLGSSPITAVRLSGDCRMAFAGARDGSVWRWRIDGVGDDYDVRVLKGHTSPVCSIRVSPITDRLISASQDGRVREWSLGRNQSPSPKPIQDGDTRWVDFSPRGDLLAVASVDVRSPGVYLHRLGRPNERPTVLCREPSFTARFSGNGARILCDGRQAIVLDLDARKPVRIFGGDDTDWSGGIAETPGTDRVISGGRRGGQIAVWNLQGHQTQLLKAGDREINDVQVSRDGRYLATAGWDGVVRVLDLQSNGRQVGSYDMGGRVYGVAFSADGTLLAIASASHAVQTLSVPDCRPLGSYTGHTGEVTSVLFVDGDRRLVTGGTDCSVRVWDVLTRRTLLALKPASASVHCVAVSRDLRRLAVATQTGAFVYSF